MTRVSLQDTTFLRAGATARRWNRETRDVSCEANDDKIELRFKMSAAGGGTTDVLLRIGAGDFATLVKTMCLVDRQSAMMSMAAELASEVAGQPNHDVELMQRARESVVDLAYEKFRAPQGDVDAQLLIVDGVEKLVEELSTKQERGANDVAWG
jgi:hypothetical protein